MTKIYIASDHAGFALKDRLIHGNLSREASIEWIDLGPGDASRVDYPDYADRVAKKISEISEASHGVAGLAAFGLLICGSGQGMAIRANRHPNVRAALTWNEESTQLSREHNDANILCLGARLIDPELAARLVKIFITTSFAGGRHSERVAKIEKPT